MLIIFRFGEKPLVKGRGFGSALFSCFVGLSGSELERRRAAGWDYQMSGKTGNEFFESVPSLDGLGGFKGDNGRGHAVSPRPFTNHERSKVAYPDCGRASGIGCRGRLREWRHLATMQLKTVLRARLPRVGLCGHTLKSPGLLKLASEEFAAMLTAPVTVGNETRLWAA